MAAAVYEWPWQYNFPPFFTIQPNLDTRQKQLDAWCNMVLSYFKVYKMYTMDVSGALTQPLFYNKSIDRKLTQEGLNVVLEELCRRGNLEWQDAGRTQCTIMWRSPLEWGKLIYRWAVDSGMTNTVCTLYELNHGDETTKQEFHELDDHVLLKSIKTLESQGKAELMGSEGVKFF